MARLAQALSGHMDGRTPGPRQFPGPIGDALLQQLLEGHPRSA